MHADVGAKSAVITAVRWQNMRAHETKIHNATLPNHFILGVGNMGTFGIWARSNSNNMGTFCVGRDIDTLRIVTFMSWDVHGCVYTAGDAWQRLCLTVT